MKKEILYEDEKVIIETTGHDYDFIATIYNKSDSKIFIYFEIEELSTAIPPNDWMGILADEEGRLMLDAIKNDRFIATWDPGFTWEAYEEVSLYDHLIKTTPVKIPREDGTFLELSPEDLERAYRYQLRQFTLEDAERQIDVFVLGYDSGFSNLRENADKFVEEQLDTFEEEYKISYEDAKAPEMLEKYASMFSARFDSSVSEDEQWHDAIQRVLREELFYATV